jgi:hypothetical protein
MRRGAFQGLVKSFRCFKFIIIKLYLFYEHPRKTLDTVGVKIIAQPSHTRTRIS